MGTATTTGEYLAIVAAYSTLSSADLTLFLKVRKLPTSGPKEKQAIRLANHDLHTYHLSAGTTATASTAPETSSDKDALALTKAPVQLPIELIAEIMDHVGDWELATAVRVPTSLEPPPDWKHRASEMDYRILTSTGSLSLLLRPSSSSSPPPSCSPSPPSPTTPPPNAPTKLGAHIAVRMAYIPILSYLLTTHPHILRENDLIPIRASRYGRTAVLAWYKHIFTHHPALLPAPKPHSIALALEAASRRGMLDSLDWWYAERDAVGGLHYTEAALEHASAKSQIPVLEWWKSHSSPSLPLKIGRVMDMASTSGSIASLSWWASNPHLLSLSPYYAAGASTSLSHALYHASCNGRIAVLDWWLESGLQLSFDSDVLTGATKHDRPDVLTWWEASGLVVQYRACDIEEALEDAIGGGEGAREWWLARGLDFRADDREWTKLQSLGGRL